MSFRDSDSLEEHQISHENNSTDTSVNFMCNRCNRVLATKQSLKEHTYTHTGKKPFRCSEVGCGKMFRQSSQLCNHRKVHKEAKRILKQQERTQGIFKIAPEKLDNGFNSSLGAFEYDGNRITLPPISYPGLSVTLPSLNSIQKINSI
jgi:uncharacterized Zn-finger protein